jgi:hypothetical protein
LDNFIDMLWGDMEELVGYTSAHVIARLVPAMFIGGASAVLPPTMIQKESTYEN